MRALALDFHRRPRPSPFGWVLLLAGLAALAALVFVHHDLVRETDASRATAMRIAALLPGAGTPPDARARDDATLTAARHAVERSKLPWGELFAALESADNQDVALLAVNPDVARGQVKIHAEARHLAAMLAFHRRLQQGATLSQVALVDHEVFKETGATPVRFHIVATWGDNRGRP